jgi:large subunit ribosomal protein L4
MADVTIYNMKKEKVGTVGFPKSFGEKANTALIHQVVVAQQTNRRQGNAKVKSRNEVRGSTRKIYRQKGTGGARHGDIKAPLFVGGGRAFGPKPKDYEVSLPQKIRQGALKAAVLQRKNEEKLWIFDELSFKEAKTKKAAELFSKFKIAGALVVFDGQAPSTEMSIRNLNRFRACRVEAMTVLEILRYEHLVMTRGAYDKFIARFIGSEGEAA